MIVRLNVTRHILLIICRCPDSPIHFDCWYSVIDREITLYFINSALKGLSILLIQQNTVSSMRLFLLAIHWQKNSENKSNHCRTKSLQMFAADLRWLCAESLVAVFLNHVCSVCVEHFVRVDSDEDASGVRLEIWSENKITHSFSYKPVLLQLKAAHILQAIPKVLANFD